MAESAPPPSTSGGWTNRQRTSNETRDMSSEEIEIGMAGLDLMSRMSSGSRPPALSGSSASTGGDHSRQHSFSSFPGSLDPAGVHRGSPPESPLYRTHNQQSSSNNQSSLRPPGLGGVSLPSPIGKSGSANNTAASSPMLSFSPSSFVDGNADQLGLGRQQNLLFGDAGAIHSMPLDVGGNTGRYLSHGTCPWGDLSHPLQNPPSDAGSWTSGNAASGANSFDNNEVDDDGLHGLGALRERAQSSPGPAMTHKGQIASSPPVGDMYPNLKAVSPLYTEGNSDHAGSRGFPADPRRLRAVPRENSSKSGSRPPRGAASSSGAHYTDSGFASGQGDRGYSGGGLPSYSMDGVSEMGSLPGYAPPSADFGNRGRSTSLGTMYYQPNSPHDLRRGTESYVSQSHIEHSHSQKFGSLPSLGSHVQQHRLPSQGMSHHQQQYGSEGGAEHNRSYSDPRLVQHHQQQYMFAPSHDYYDDATGYHGTLRVEGESVHSGSNVPSDMRFIQHSNLSRSKSAGSTFSQSRQTHGQPGMHGGYEQEDPRMSGRRHAINPVDSFGGQPSLQRRDALDFAERLPQVMATQEEMRLYGIQGSQHDRGIGQSAHNRAHSDGDAMFSLAPRSGSQLSTSLDDDLTHPLAGEHIADPSDEGTGPNYSGVLSSLPPHASYSEEPRHPLRPQSRHSFTTMSSVDPQLPSLTPAPRVVYTVKFKRTQRNFVAGPRVTRDIEIGCYVKVEADRGEDLGIIVVKMPSEKFTSPGRSSLRETGPPREMGSLPGMSAAADLKRIIRPATHDEVSLLTVKRQEEDELLSICRTKVRQRALPMNVVDAEYQFDRHKLTFFFEAEGRIDFRELVRDLFSMYKTRIWMQQLDKSPSVGAPISVSQQLGSLSSIGGGGDHGVPSNFGGGDASSDSVHMLGPPGMSN